MTAKRIWEIIEPIDTTFARCGLRSPARVVQRACARCMINDITEMPEPLELEWEPGSDIVGDFVWPGMGRVAVQQHVFDALASVSPGLRAGRVEMVQDPKLKRSTRRRPKHPRVWLPYEGPPLVELVVEPRVELLPETTTEVAMTCPVCGAERRVLVGIEIKQHRWDHSIEDLVSVHIPRVPGAGVFVSEKSVASSPIFRGTRFHHAIICTDMVREFIINTGFTNIDFLELGELR